MRSINLLILLILVVGVVVCEHYVNSQQQSLVYYQQFSHMAILHVFYNHHFSKSSQFQPFITTLRLVEDKVEHYARIVVTNCQESKQSKSMDTCVRIKRANQNRLLVGFMPSNQMTTFGSQLIQGSPHSKVYDHVSDRYEEDQLILFISSLTPNFYKQLHSIQQYYSFLLPHYVPKLILFWNQQSINSIPLVLKQLNVQYYLKFDFGFVQDLTQEILKEINITSIPTLLIIKYDFQNNSHIMTKYPGKSFEESNYQQLDNFLAQHCLNTPRNDLVYHKINMQTDSNIITIYKQSQLRELQEKANGWMIIQRTKQYTPNKLLQLQSKYSRYYDYVHLVDDQKQVLQFYSPQMNKTYISTGQLEFHSLNHQDFLSNASLWLQRDYTLIAVREKYGHLCTLAEKILFRSLVYCLIAKQSDYDAIANSFGYKFNIGVIWNKRMDDGGKKEAAGVQITSVQFETAYKLLEYRVRIKVKQIMDKFNNDPIDQITNSSPLHKICFLFNKKCAIFITIKSDKKDKTKRDYLKQIAHELAEEYRFYQVDPTCNHDLLQQVRQINSQLNFNRDKLIVYHPRLQSISLMESKMTKSNIENFLRHNYGQTKSVKLKKLNNPQIILNNCEQNKQTFKQNFKQNYKQQQM